MEVILIEEENHGLIGAVTSYAKAIDFLVETEWLTGSEEILTFDSQERSTIKKVYGRLWPEILKTLTPYEIEFLLDGKFFFTKINIYGAC